jgi:nicotinamidase-related amidase
MSENRRLPRSPELMSRGDTALLVVDVQEKLMPAIADGRRVIWNVRRLIDGAKILGLPVIATEQYPKGLGPTVGELAQRLGPVATKLSFSCGGSTNVAPRPSLRYAVAYERKPKIAAKSRVDVARRYRAVGG